MIPRNAHLWLPAWLRQQLRRAPVPRGPLHVYFCIADHYEPYWAGADADAARGRVHAWLEAYPRLAEGHADSDGSPPRHTFFYPEEEYDRRLLDDLAVLCRRGYGDIEVHLHHDRDSAPALEGRLRSFTGRLHRDHGMLRRDPRSGEIVWAFVHGNWALDNSHPEGRWCGVDNEIDVLVRCGCRLDMTMPSAPSATQTRTINSIYYAAGRPGCRKAHDEGRPAAVGSWRADDELLLIQGPLTLDWSRRKAGLLPRIENGELSADHPPAAARVALWQGAGVRVAGAPNHLFIKVHTHGAQPETMATLLGSGLTTLWSALEAQVRDAPDMRLHYVTAWDMYLKVRELARGQGATERAA